MPATPRHACLVRRAGNPVTAAAAAGTSPAVAGGLAAPYLSPYDPVASDVAASPGGRRSCGALGGHGPTRPRYRHPDPLGDAAGSAIAVSPVAGSVRYRGAVIGGCVAIGAAGWIAGWAASSTC